MRYKAFDYPLYLVLSESNCLYFPWIEVARQAILGGVKVIQLREKECSTKEYLERAKKLKQLTDLHGVPLIINDSAQVAIESGAWGVHVGQNDIPPYEIIKMKNAPQCIGWSLEDEKQLQDKKNMDCVTYLGISPVFVTPTKRNTITEWGIDGLRKLRRETACPLVAIGGIKATNTSEILHAGADSIAVVSAICSSQNPYFSALELSKMIEQNKRLT